MRKISPLQPAEQRPDGERAPSAGETVERGASPDATGQAPGDVASQSGVRWKPLLDQQPAEEPPERVEAPHTSDTQAVTFGMNASTESQRVGEANVDESLPVAGSPFRAIRSNETPDAAVSGEANPVELDRGATTLTDADRAPQERSPGVAAWTIPNMGGVSQEARSLDASNSDVVHVGQANAGATNFGGAIRGDTNGGEHSLNQPMLERDHLEQSNLEQANLEAGPHAAGSEAGRETGDPGSLTSAASVGLDASVVVTNDKTESRLEANGVSGWESSGPAPKRFKPHRSLWEYPPLSDAHGGVGADGGAVPEGSAPATVGETTIGEAVAGAAVVGNEPGAAEGVSDEASNEPNPKRFKPHRSLWEYPPLSDVHGGVGVDGGVRAEVGASVNGGEDANSASRAFISGSEANVEPEVAGSATGPDERNLEGEPTNEAAGDLTAVEAVVAESEPPRRMKPHRSLWEFPTPDAEVMSDTARPEAVSEEVLPPEATGEPQVEAQAVGSSPGGETHDGVIAALEAIPEPDADVMTPEKLVENVEALVTAATPEAGFSEAAVQDAAVPERVLPEAVQPEPSQPELAQPEDAMPGVTHASEQQSQNEPVAIEAMEHEVSTPMVLEPEAAGALDAAGSEAGATESSDSELASVSGPADQVEAPQAAADPMAPMVLDPSAFSDVGSAPVELTPEQMQALLAQDAEAGSWGTKPLELTAEKAELLQFMVADAGSAVEQLTAVIDQCQDFSTRAEAAQALVEQAREMQKIGEFFSFASRDALVSLLMEIGTQLLAVPEALVGELLLRVRGIQNLLEQHTRTLEVGMELSWNLEVLTSRVKKLMAGVPLHPGLCAWHKNDPERVLELDLVTEGIDPPPKESDLPAWDPSQAAVSEGAKSGGASGTTPNASGGDKEATIPTMRVPVETINGMLATVSRLVLAKNQLARLNGEARKLDVAPSFVDQLAAATDELGKLTVDLQLSVMQARTQPIHRLFERYPRVVQSVAQLADRLVQLVVEGDDVPVEKSLFDALGEPLNQLLRAIVGTQMQGADERRALGKPQTATIRMWAESSGTRVLVNLCHDGVTLTREAILARASGSAQALGMEPDALSRLGDNEVYELLFRPEVGDEKLASAAQQIQAIGGTVVLHPQADGMRFELTFPVETAAIAAIMVDVGREIYAAPLEHVHEIVRFADHAASSINQHPTLRVRDDVLPVIDLAERVGVGKIRQLAESASELTEAAESASALDAGSGLSSGLGSVAEAKLASDERARAAAQGFGLVVSAGENKAVLRVDQIIGKQEIVVNKLSEQDGASMFAGATIRNDGGVSLIFDVARLMKA
ncbi:MAG: chemotaxis protein CheW [Planctomycetota bacterium]|nr:chemotaxis protein CheW [Planctomycetota bacterium]